MPIKKNIWLLFYACLALGLVYLVASAYSRWEAIKTDAIVELAYLNRIFSSSLTLNFDQQEIMLDLLGHQLLAEDSKTSIADEQRMLDSILKQNHSLLAFGLANLDGEIVLGSSNLDLDRMPNLKQFENSRKSFLKAMELERMVLGRAYFLTALDDQVIPIRKGIRDNENRLVGMMTAGIKPRELLPQLDSIKLEGVDAMPYRLQIFHDYDFYYAFVSGTTENSQLREIIDTPIPAQYIQMLDQSARQQLGLGLEDLRDRSAPVVFSAPDRQGKTNLYSLNYLPKYQIWVNSIVARDFLLAQLWPSLIFYMITFLVVSGLAYFLFRQIARVEQRNHDELLRQASRDFLTGLKNRQFLRLAEAAWTGKGAAPFSVFFIDLDNFKNINDSHGHSYGDVLLKQVAQRLLSIFSDKDLVCRQGGDEFIVISHKCDEASIMRLASEVLESLASPYYVENYNFVMGASIGVAHFPTDGDSFETLFSAADTAMYKAKNVKNSFYIFSSQLHDELMETTDIQQALPKALEEGEFSLVYQPQVLDGQLPVGVEALIRWKNGDLGQVPPDRFIRVSEGNGMIIDIGHFVIDQSLYDLAEINRHHFGQNLGHHYQQSLDLSINVSIRQLQENGFTERLSASLTKYDFPANQLTLEITEGIFVDDLQYLIPVLHKIRSLGVKLSMDDFGTGYSSLSLLKQLPIDELKIDKSFIDNITTHNEDRLMVLNIIDIAQNLGIKVVAEGIEQGEQSRLLLELDCNLQQGYYYCGPVNFDQLIDYCEQSIWRFDNIAEN
ncbi:MAG: EAL domain-containing protein [Gammaproteobacteria bacterium]|nr:EAL domain-containing protein [Gammaproteobacteria bacterium]